MKKNIFRAMAILILVLGIANVNALTISENEIADTDADTKVTVDGSTVKLIADLDENIVIDNSKITLDLNGHTVSHPCHDLIVVTNGSEVTITGNGTMTNTQYQGISITSSKVTLENGSLNTQECGVVVWNNATFIMNGGTITTVDNSGISGNGSAQYGGYKVTMNGGTINANITSAGYASCGIYHPNVGTVTMNGGTINSSNGAGIVQRAGSLTVNGGTINAKQKVEEFKGKVGDSRQVVPASAIVVDVKSNYPGLNTDPIKTEVDGKVIMNSDADNLYTLGQGAEIKAKGGVYNTTPEDKDIAEGYKAYEIITGKNKGMYEIVKPSELKEVVNIEKMKAEEVSEEDVNLINGVLNDKYKVAAYYNAIVTLETPNGNVVGYVTETTEDKTIKFDIPSDIPKLEKNYKRTFAITRIHEGKATLITDVKATKKAVSGTSKEFSTYALVYTDVLDTVNPKTSDNIITYIGLIGLSIVAIVLPGLYIKNKMQN